MLISYYFPSVPDDGRTLLWSEHTVEMLGIAAKYDINILYIFHSNS